MGLFTAENNLKYYNSIQIEIYDKDFGLSNKNFVMLEKKNAETARRKFATNEVWKNPLQQSFVFPQNVGNGLGKIT